LAGRLFRIYTRLQAIIAHYQPTEAAVEEVFMHQNPQSALKLGHARGAALLALAQAGLTVIAEYPTRIVKKSLVGTGAATKAQVQFMVQTILKSPEISQLDATDALAVALCHAHSRELPNALSSHRSRSRQRRLWTRLAEVTS
jgi:crossover junction endodeoxyribonuclease RuvC